MTIDLKQPLDKKKIVSYHSLLTLLLYLHFCFEDGTYYTTVRALNNVQYGGPLATTVCHTAPYIVDMSPPFVWEIFDIKYDEDTFQLNATHNSRYSEGNKLFP